MNANATCRDCHAPIVWLLNPATDKKVPVDARTVNKGDRHFARTSGHINHRGTCPEAQKHAANTRRGVAQAAQLASASGPVEVYDDFADADMPRSSDPMPYNRRPHQEKPPLEVPKDASAEVEALYRRCHELGIDRQDMRSILAQRPYYIGGQPMRWDAATLARARQAIEDTARSMAAVADQAAAARAHPHFPRR